MSCITSPEAELIALVNQFRAENGRLPLVVSDVLMDSAQHWAEYIARHDYWPDDPHTGPDGSTHTSRAHVLGYPKQHWVGGNLLYGKMTPFDAFTTWRNSPPHRANLLGNYREIGVALAVEPAWDYQGDVFAAACMDLSAGTTAIAVRCNGVPKPEPPPKTKPTKPTVPRVPPPTREERQRERWIRRMLRKFGVKP